MVLLGVALVAAALQLCREVCEGASAWHIVRLCTAIGESPPWTLLSAIAAAPALLLTWYWRTVHKEQEIATETSRLELDRFVRAVELLAEEKNEARLGGIYALERIARDPATSPQDAGVVTSILCAFIRQYAAVTDTSEDPDPYAHREANYDEPSFYVAAAVQVVGRLPSKAKQHAKIDLRRTSLYGLRLDGDFAGAQFDHALLASCVFTGYLLEATFKGADLADADLSQAIVAHKQLADAWDSHGLKLPPEGIVEFYEVEAR
jgi:hypothetical protein